jgi:hypothetical protein
MLRIVAAVAIVWLALMPPLFTGGACTAEFERETRRLESDRKSLSSPALAAAYWSARRVPFAVIPPDQCRKAKPRFLQRCGSGALVYAQVPVENGICRLYRDDEIRVQLQFDERDRLARQQLDMNLYRSLPLPFGVTLHWGR